MAEQDTTNGRPSRYKLLDLIEEGVCGKLYRAHDTQEDRPVLLKLIARPVSRDPQFRRCLYDRWAQRDTLFQHPNVARIVEVGKTGHQYFMAVEDPGGECLAAKLKRAPLPPEEATDILRQIAEALRAAHRQDVTHGFLKPSDVFVTRDAAGRTLVKVAFLDLGATSADGLLSLFGQACGSPKYMAPEVIRGRMPGPASDIFALGVIGYELLTGAEPFPSAHPLGYLFANCEVPFRPPHEVREGVPKEISSVVSRCLERDTERRFLSVQSVIDDIDRCLETARTGNVSAVPPAADSALARDYRAAAAKPTAKGARGVLSPLTMAALVLALAALVVAVVINLAHLRGTFEATPTTAAAPTTQHESAPPTEPVKPPQQLQAERALAEEKERNARTAYENALKDWQERFGRDHSYDLGITKFLTVANDSADTSAGQQAREMAAQIYCEWAEALAEDKNFKDAEDKLRAAGRAMSDQSQFRDMIQRRLPKLMAEHGAYACQQGEYGEALAAFRKLNEEFPGTPEGSLLAAQEPGICYNQSVAIWKKNGRCQEALDGFQYLIKQYPASKEAAEAQKRLPEVCLDIAARQLESGEPGKARATIAELRKNYPDTEPATKALALDEEILDRKLQEARTAKDKKAMDECLSDLVTTYPRSKRAQVALRERLELMPGPNEAMSDPATAQKRYQEATVFMDTLCYDTAASFLRAVIRNTAPDSETALAAIEKLPACAYFGALHHYGLGRGKEAEDRLTKLADDFSFSPWGQRAAQTLQKMRAAPEGMVFVPEGRFQMGASKDEIVQFLIPYYPAKVLNSKEDLDVILKLVGYAAEMPKHVAETKSFYVDTTEVTNAQYKKFMDATSRGAPAGWQDGAFPAGGDNLPVTGVTFEDAQAYAKWAGKRLPTETEWEKAARGVDGRPFPWGDEFDASACHHLRKTDAGPAAVGSYPKGASTYGALDMIGNVWEWTQSPFVAYAGNDVTDTLLPYGPDKLVLRGGAWYQNKLERQAVPTTCVFRFPIPPDIKTVDLGFRCVKDAD